MSLPIYQVGSEISLRNATVVASAGLLAIAQGQTVFDFSDLTLVDSSAVASLIAWKRAATAQSLTLTLQAMPVNLLSLVRLYGVDELLSITPADRH